MKDDKIRIQPQTTIVYKNNLRSTSPVNENHNKVCIEYRKKNIVFQNGIRYEE